MRRVWLGVLVCVLLALTAVAAPYVVQEDLTPSENPVSGGTLYLSLTASPQSFLFYGTLDNNAYTVIGQMMTGLVELHPVTNAITPGLAESWAFVYLQNQPPHKSPEKQQKRFQHAQGAD